MKVKVIYGSDTGNTRTIAQQIADLFETEAIDVATANTQNIEDCDLLILGTCTAGYGDLQADWEGKVHLLAESNLEGRKVALFGLGDQMTYADTFLDAMGILYEEVVAKGATVVGSFPKDGFDFFTSRAVRDDRFVGLALDEDNQSSETEQRIAAWVAKLKVEELLPA